VRGVVKLGVASMRLDENVGVDSNHPPRPA
jgi:hypothetical protein